MPASLAQLTLKEFEERYASEPGWEFWFGEAVRKPVPDWMHSMLQLLLGELLREAGYFSGSELELRVTPDWHPRPDVTGALSIEGSYPTTPPDVVMEILSDDQVDYIYRKCEHYAKIGVPQIYLFDPKRRTIKIWDRLLADFQRVENVVLDNGSTIGGNEIWSKFEERLPDDLK